MMKKNVIRGLVLLPVLFGMGYASAATIDYRHEYTARSKEQKDRIRVSHRFDNNISFALEGKWVSKKAAGHSKAHAYSNNVSGGQEFELAYLYKINDQLSLSPAIVIESNSSSTTYKPQIKAEYKVTPQFTFSARYRYGDKVNDRSNASHPDDQHFHQGNFVFAYKFDSFNVSYDFEVKKLIDYKGWKDKKRDYAHNIVVQVPIDKNWVPFAELGYVTYHAPGTDRKEDWQVRYRAGVKYNF